MKGQIDTVEDDFWTERLPFFTAQFPSYYRKPQQVHGRVHASNERYFDGSHEIFPLTHRHGQRIYVMMQPYVLEPKLTLTVGLYSKPKKYADQDSPIGEVIGSNHEGFREVQLGSAQAWYYPADKTIAVGRSPPRCGTPVRPLPPWTCRGNSMIEVQIRPARIHQAPWRRRARFKAHMKKYKTVGKIHDMSPLPHRRAL